MKDFLSWLKDNLSHLFAIIGIVLTVYFSVFYVPQYSKDLKLKRIEGVHSELISTVQELVYNEHVIDCHDIETLIKGKELRDSIEYPYSIDELLIQVQESFLGNKFIPLKSRKELVESIDTLRDTIKPKDQPSKPTDKLIINYTSLLSAVLGVILSISGFYSLYSSTKRLRNQEVKDRFEEHKDNIQNKMKRVFALEEHVERKLQKLYGENCVSRLEQTDFEVDFIVSRNDKPIFGVEVRYSDKDSIPINIIKKLTHIANFLGYPIVLVTNAHPLMIEKYLKNSTINEMHNSNVYIVSVDEIEKIEDIINKSA